MRITICGARGSTPAVGPEYARYGGHTTCVTIARDGEPPALVLDAGTGIRSVTAMLDGAAFTGTILCSHLHWDHVQGLPFFAAADRADARVRLLVPPEHESDGAEAVDALVRRMMSPPFFPIGPDGLRGDWSLGPLRAGDHELEGLHVLVREVPHKGGRTFGFRVSDGRGAFAFLPDHGPGDLGPGLAGHGPYHDVALELAAGADLLLHDAQYTAAEFPAVAHYGHSTIEYAVGLAVAAGVDRLLLHHHDPARTDDALDALVAGLDAPLPVEAARAGQVLDLP